MATAPVPARERIEAMALNPNATFTWYGHSCWEVTTPGG
jgi:hypothetical protein